MLYVLRIPIFPIVFMLFNRVVFGAYIPASAHIGSNVRFAYGGSGVVVHGRSVIGDGCVIGPGVTIGGRSGHEKVPVLGSNVYVAGGAKVLGPISIGNNVVIGANAVVINDIPDDAVVAGVPAKIIKKSTNKWIV